MNPAATAALIGINAASVSRRSMAVTHTHRSKTVATRTSGKTVKAAEEHLRPKICDEAAGALRKEAGVIVADARASIAEALAALDRTARALGESAETRARVVANEARERVMAAGGSLSHEVCERPLAAITLAAGVGLLLGVLLSPRR